MTSDDEMNFLRERQLLLLVVLASDTKPATSRRYNFRPEYPKHATGNLDVALCARRAHFLGPNATDWPAQFVVGFPLEGALPHRFTFPR